jgi:hypothetical protein
VLHPGGGGRWHWLDMQIDDHLPRGAATCGLHRLAGECVQVRKRRLRRAIPATKAIVAGITERYFFIRESRQAPAFQYM